MTILDEIVSHKREEIARKKSQGRTFNLKDMDSTRDFYSSVTGEGMSIITEIKRCSPSRGTIRADVDPAHIAAIYHENGAAAMSVLTDEKYFCGSDDFIAAVKAVVGVPVLRKEFIVDPWQIYESKALGADAILLIAALLDQYQTVDFLTLARDLGLYCLVEVHTEAELEKILVADVRMIGINNRDLTTMSVDLATSLRLRNRIPSGLLTVSESGIQSREDIQRLKEAGFDAVLVGETLMSAPDVGVKLRELLGR